jgi:hypothetical protein
MPVRWVVLIVVLLGMVSSAWGLQLSPPDIVLNLPVPTEVWGKEYSHEVDRDQNGVADPLQVLAWDGTGVVSDSFDYTNSGVPTNPFGEELDVDALANGEDAFFEQVVANQVPLLVSGRDDKVALDLRDPIWYELPDGTHNTWATWPQVDAEPPGNANLDGLEVWGPVVGDDSDYFSVFSDPAPVGGGDVSVWNYDSLNNISTPFIFQTQIATAINIDQLYVDEVDVDALMVHTESNQVMFSIWPIIDPSSGGYVLDGGEIWVWDYTNPAAGAAQFLNHGGHLWDTNFDVAGFFGVADPLDQNIDALEAVAIPEGSTLALFGLGLFGLAAYARRRRK